MGLCSFVFFVIFEKTRFVEDEHRIGFAVGHMKGGDREDDLFPGEAFDVLQREHEAAVFGVNGEFVLADGGTFNVLKNEL